MLQSYRLSTSTGLCAKYIIYKNKEFDFAMSSFESERALLHQELLRNEILNAPSPLENERALLHDIVRQFYEGPNPRLNRGPSSQPEACTNAVHGWLIEFLTRCCWDCLRIRQEDRC